ncbi:MAG: UvrD-like helicase C-terminal domain, partial [Mycobacterium sp.]|nr:UvrD-like helicase C-terminal domain [Mycobacterium sp.]
VELGYAQTVHGAQGATVDHSLLIVDGPIDGRALYVGMTRGADKPNR